MSEMELRDAILRHSLNLLRLSAGQQAEAELIIRELEQELRALLQTDALSDAGKAEIKALIAEADKVIDGSYAEAAAVSDTHALAVIVAKNAVAAIEDVLPVAVAAPTAERLASLTQDVLIDGSPASAWWSKQAQDTAFKFASVVRQGVVNGWTNEQIARRVAGPDGFMLTARRNARALVQSSVMSAANEARLSTFRKNAKLIAGVRWLSTLDSHTCIQCAALDGQAWNLDGEKLSDTRIPFRAPPAHFSCRCVLAPIPKTFADLGLDIAEPGAGTRASAAGPISATTAFSDFLKRQPEPFVEEVLGKRRAAMFLSGKLTLRDLISGTGRELTLDELA